MPNCSEGWKFQPGRLFAVLSRQIRTRMSVTIPYTCFEHRSLLAIREPQAGNQSGLFAQILLIEFFIEQIQSVGGSKLVQSVLPFQISESC